MKNRNILMISILIIFIITVITITIYYSSTKKEPSSKPNVFFDPLIPSESGEKNDVIIPTDGNDTVVSTKSETKLRYINNYTTKYFTAEKNLLIMFGSWCSHCQSEIVEIEKILEYYKDSKKVNVILIAHEYESTISDLISLVENDVNFGDIELFIDLKRTIRKNIDPEANSVPISYVVDKTGNIIRKHDSEITLDVAKDMLK